MTFVDVYWNCFRNTLSVNVFDDLAWAASSRQDLKIALHSSMSKPCFPEATVLRSLHAAPFTLLAANIHPANGLQDPRKNIPRSPYPVIFFLALSKPLSQ